VKRYLLEEFTGKLEICGVCPALLPKKEQNVNVGKRPLAFHL
jgi:hypothetical protein